jgi:hypothetical protein
MYILTEEYNDYGQHGAYFRAAWLDIPTDMELAKHVGSTDEDYLRFILSGGGRRNFENIWYCLTQYNEGEKF